MTKMLLKLPDQPLQVIETSEKYFMNATQPYIGNGNLIQYLYQDGTEFNLAVDEEGLLKRLPLNFFTKLVTQKGEYIQPLVGPVVFARCKPINPRKQEIWDFELTDVTEEDYKKVALSLTYECQKAMAQHYRQEQSKYK